MVVNMDMGRILRSWANSVMMEVVVPLGAASGRRLDRSIRRYGARWAAGAGSNHFPFLPRASATHCGRSLLIPGVD